MAEKIVYCSGYNALILLRNL